MSKDEFAKELCKGLDSSAGPGVGAIDWSKLGALIPVIIKILQLLAPLVPLTPEATSAPK